MFLRQSAFTASVVFCTANLLIAAPSGGIKLTELTNKLRIEINGELFTEYCYNDAPHVYFYPVIGPGNLAMTRNAPMKTTGDEDIDHPHHRSLWYSHGEVNGIDFWAESAKAGKIVHQKFIEIKSGADKGWFKAAHAWIAPDGKTICTDETKFEVLNESPDRVFDFEITLKASEGMDVTLGDTKEGSMAFRVAETMRLKPNKFNTSKPTGHIVQSTGVRDGDTWGKRAAWCDYYGTVAGKTLGVAILDHPKNPRHPTWWHVRDYGLFAANPFGTQHFEKKPPGEGNLVIPAGKSATFRYRFVLHSGDEKEGKIAQRFKEFSTPSPLK